MELSDSETEYEYEQYDLCFFEEDEGPPLIKTKCRLVAAVVNNQVDVLRELLDSPRWYNVRDKWGYDLLQISILRDKQEVFDYMLSLPDFPLEYVNKEGQTALVVSLDGFISNDIWMSGHFSYELVKKGVNIDVVCFEGNSPLHQALERSYCRTSKALIERGVDVNTPNSDGCAPLEVALFYVDRDVCEIICALLAHGAEPSVDFFEKFISKCQDSEFQQILFLYTFDSFSQSKIKFEIVLQLAQQESPLFEDIIKYPKFSIENDDSLLCMLCTLTPNYLRRVIERSGSLLKEGLVGVEFLNRIFYPFSRPFNIENLNVLLENDIVSVGQIVEFSSSMSFLVFQNCIHGCDEGRTTELYCFFLSYGFNLGEEDLQVVYEKFGYCELFKILLHMDFQITGNYRKAFPMIIYNPRINLDKYLQEPITGDKRYYRENINELVHYFAHTKLVEIHKKLSEKGDLEKKENLPQLPCLVELARNSFREYFIKKFNIQTSKQFFTLLNCLPVSYIHKKILSYETKLY